MAINFCLTIKGDNVVSANCNPMTGPTDDQKWNIGRRRDFFNEDYGHDIQAFQILNSNGKCLDIAN